MENIKNLFTGIPVYMYLLLLLVFGLFVASFFLPPLGIIHPSVLQAGAIILGFCWLFYIKISYYVSFILSYTYNKRYVFNVLNDDNKIINLIINHKDESSFC